jgi:hypothetical protein
MSGFQIHHAPSEDPTNVKSDDTAVTEQADAIWEAGTGTTASIVAPDAIAAAIAAIGGGGLASGTKALFVQTNAPTGWTKDTDQNDKALRIVSGTPGTGGTSAFSTVFGLTATDAHTLTESEIPAHTHGLTRKTNQGSSDFIHPASGGGETAFNSGSTGGSGSHSHNMDLQVSYLDVIKATKD